MLLSGICNLTGLTHLFWLGLSICGGRGLFLLLLSFGSALLLLYCFVIGWLLCREHKQDHLDNNQLNNSILNQHNCCKTHWPAPDNTSSYTKLSLNIQTNYTSCSTYFRMCTKTANAQCKAHAKKHACVRCCIEKLRVFTLAAVFLAFGSGLGPGFWWLKEDNRMKKVKKKLS